jgi:hypothetical protein
MRATASAALSAFIAAIPFVAQAEGKDHAGQVTLAPAASYNAKWDECEALARKRGTPPGTRGYGDFIESCVRSASSAHPARGAPAASGSR